MEITKENIWNFAQNKPSLVVGDIIQKYKDIPSDFIYAILLKRDVFKWLAARRDIIKLKDKWKKEITSTIEEMKKRKKKEIIARC